MRIMLLPIATALLALAGCKESAPQEPAGAAAPGASASQQTPVAGPLRHIFAFGDSLFAGYGIGVQNSYPAKLGEALRARGINVKIVNAAVSGETSAAGSKRLGYALDAQKPKPDLVLLELGGNDMLRGQPPAGTRANFAAMLGELKQRGIPVVLMGMRAPPNYGPEYQRDFDALYADLAREYGATLVPFWLEAIYDKPALFQNDRIHPTAEGIDILVEDTLDEVAAAIPPAKD
ncbi:arylesterase [Qipengyuania marisflavi]|uniref:Arylesterase n=1 Tax=Qipengyuania marisflavi TaxID=2486356 RepID=A0A5S3PA55_9SPHN|nr:arylesterase [Qipengyuania marisflavi]TMM50394.1 arylesterase [Qipengyuania marisflavi]